VWEGEFKDELWSEPAAVSAAEGLVDFARRWARVEHRPTEAERELVGRLSERFPGVADDEEDDEPAVSVYDGGRSLFGSSAGWTQLGEGLADDPLRPNHPLWLLEVLGGAEPNLYALGQETVRGGPTTRYGCRLDVEAARRRGFGWLPSERRARPFWRALRVDVWLDDSGAIRRTAWTSLPYLRPRAVWPPRPGPSWRVVELWDFGVPVEVAVPSNVEQTPPQPFWKTMIELWSWGRDLKREAGHEG
jgi:hypothetical protein